MEAEEMMGRRQQTVCGNKLAYRGQGQTKLAAKEGDLSLADDSTALR